MNLNAKILIKPLSSKDLLNEVLNHRPAIIGRVAGGRVQPWLNRNTLKIIDNAIGGVAMATPYQFHAIIKSTS